MGYSMGSTCYLRPPLLPPIFTFASSSKKKLIQEIGITDLKTCFKSTRAPFVLYTKSRNSPHADDVRLSTHQFATYACSHRSDIDDDNFTAFSSSHLGRRREAFLLGASIVPPLLLLHLKAAAEDTDATITQKNQKSEEVILQRDPPNPFSLLSGLGVFTTGTLGALYALSRKDKQSADAAVESLRNSLKDKDTDILALEQRYEAMAMTEQEERTKERKKSAEEKRSLMNQLNLANTTIYGLGRELKSEKHLAEKLTVEKDAILARLSKAGEYRRSLEENLKEKVHLVKNLEERISSLSLELKAKDENLRGISSDLANKELEFINMNSSYMKTKDELLKAHMEIDGLNNDILSIQKDLESKIAEIIELNSAISTLVSEKDDVEKDLVDLASASDRRAAADAKLLDDARKELLQLGEQLKHYQKELMLFEDTQKELRLVNEQLKHYEKELMLFEDTQKELRLVNEQLKHYQKELMLFEDTQKELRLVDEQLKHHQKELMESQKQFSELTSERDGLEKLLTAEVSKVSSVNQELSMIKEQLVNSERESSNLLNCLEKSKNVSSELEAEISRIQAEHSEERSSLHRSLDDATQEKLALVGEVSSVKALMENGIEELQKASQELASLLENDDSQRKEFVDDL